MFEQQIDDPIGLDISELSVKFVQFKPKGTRLELAAFADVPIPPGLVSEDIIANEHGLVDFLVELFGKRTYHAGKVRGRSIVASIPESKAFVKVISLPKLDPEELVTAVPIEAEQYIPLPLDQMQIDWQPVGEVNGKLRVLITATPKEYVQNLVRVLNSAGLVPQALEPESAAITRALLSSKGGDAGTLILDMDAARTSLIVYADNSVQFTSSLPMAGNALTDAIAKSLSIDTKEAEHIKRLHGVPTFTPSNKRVSEEVSKMMSEISQSLEPVLANLYDEMKNTIRFHEEHNTEGEAKNTFVTQVVLCGGTAKLPNIADYLQAKIGADPYFQGRAIKVTLGDAWRNVIDVGDPPFSRREALSYTTAIGLALRNYIK